MIGKKTRIFIGIVLTLSLLVLLLSGCGGEPVTGKPVIKVGSKDFTESLLLGELYALALEKQGYQVDRKLNLGSALVHDALVNGDIDLYPEYTGTGLLSVLKESPVFDARQAYEKVRARYEEKFGLIWLEPAAANDSQGLVITRQAADKYGIRTISDLQRQAPHIRFASQGQFDEREDGLPALSKAYGEFRFKDRKLYDNGLKYDVLHNGEADVAVAYTTEGQLSRPEFVVLEDDRQVWPPYNIAPVIRQAVLEKNPEIKDILNRITAVMDNQTIIKLNAEVDINKREYTEVAKEFFERLP